MSNWGQQDECKSCRAKPGSPLLCDSCLLRQTEYSKYHWARMSSAGYTLHAYPVPLLAELRIAVCSGGYWWGEETPTYVNSPRCNKCVRRLDKRALRALKSDR